MRACLVVALLGIPLLITGCQQQEPAPAAPPTAPQATTAVLPLAPAENSPSGPQVLIDAFTGRPIPGRKPAGLSTTAPRTGTNIRTLPERPALEALLDLFRRGVVHPIAPRRWAVGGLAPYATLQQAVAANDLYAVEDRLRSGLPLDAPDGDGRSPLLVAAMENRPHIADLLIDRGADLKFRDVLGNSVMHLAAKSTHVYTLENFHRRGAELEVRNDRNYTPLHEASEAGELFAVQRLVGMGADIFTMADENVLSFPAILAARSQRWEVTAYFRSLGQFLPLHLMAAQGDMPGVAEALDDFPEEINSADKVQSTMLMSAVNTRQQEMIALLLERGADMTLINFEGDTALSLALRRPCLECAELLLQHGDDINQRRTMGYERTLLNETVRSNTPDVLQFMLSHGANPNLPDPVGRSPLHVVVDLNDLTKARELLTAGADPDLKDTAGWSPLLVAAREGLTALLEVFVEAGADLSSETASGQTLLHLAAAAGHEDTAAWILDRGANLDKEDSTRQSPLHKAAEAGHQRLVTLLLDRGARIDALDASACTPFLVAIKAGQDEVARLLLERGAFKDAVDQQNRNAIFLALEVSNVRFARDLAGAGVHLDTRSVLDQTVLFPAAVAGDSELVRWLIDAGQDPARADRQGQTPLHRAAAGGDADTVELLLERGVPIQAMDTRGRTPLHHAAERGNTFVLKLLLGGRAALSVTDQDGRMPIHDAARAGHAPAVRLLHAAGAPLSATDAQGQTPLHLAASRGRLDACRQLLRSGANLRVLDSMRASPRDAVSAALEALDAPGGPDTDSQRTDLVRVRSFLDAVILEEYRAAAIHGNSSIMKELLAVYPEFSGAISLGHTPAHWAAAFGQVAVLNLLKACRADLLALTETAEGYAALHLAVLHNQTDAARCLLDAGVPAELKSAQGETALEIARRLRLDAMVALLNQP